jgi:hypothetical protein
MEEDFGDKLGGKIQGFAKLVTMNIFLRRKLFSALHKSSII